MQVLDQNQHAAQVRLESNGQRDVKECHRVQEKGVVVTRYYKWAETSTAQDVIYHCVLFIRYSHVRLMTVLTYVHSTGIQLIESVTDLAYK